MSRTPVREALQTLARERLVRVLPRRGVLVTELDVGRQLRMLEVRREIDRLLAAHAAVRRTAEEAHAFVDVAEAFAISAERDDGTLLTRADRVFNSLVSAAARNEFAAEASSLTQGLSRRFWYAHRRRYSSVAIAAELHRGIALAIADGEESAAAAASDSLLDHVEAYTRATLAG
jgi:DNA-binding GntR family transcriptional regulator